jgi:hypothetical protein
MIGLSIGLIKIDDDMASGDGHTILAQTPCVFYGGENCKVITTLHNIVGNTGEEV